MTTIMDLNKYSQYGQEVYLDRKIFKGFTNGYFVDVGAYDGVKFSNTYFFEKDRNWSGINIEPNAPVYQKLTVNRPTSINIQCAIDIDDGGELEFISNTGRTDVLSGLQKYYNPKHQKRLDKELSTHGGDTTIVKVPTRRLDSVFRDNNVKHVHLLSIDVEGAEDVVLRSINFDEVFIDVIMFEDNYKTSAAIIHYLRKHGYVVVNKHADIYMIHKKSQFYKR